MSAPEVSTFGGNRLLAGLAQRERGRLLAASQLVPLVEGEVLCEVGHQARHVYFPTAGAISLLTDLALGPQFEVALTGCEGMLGTEVVLGARTAALQAVVRVAGMAHRIAASAFRRELASSPGLQAAMGRYVQVLMVHLASALACTRFHTACPRLARSLLMVQDRAGSADFELTHESLAHTLALRRVSVTDAAGALAQRGIIRYRRGHITVSDRPALLAAACGCYVADGATYERLLGPVGRRAPSRPSRSVGKG